LDRRADLVLFGADADVADILAAELRADQREVVIELLLERGHLPARWAQWSEDGGK